MSIEKMPNGRKMESRPEFEICPICRGMRVTSATDKRPCIRCKGTGRLPSTRR